MERIRHEAKRLIKRKQITLSTSSTTTASSSLETPDTSADKSIKVSTTSALLSDLETKKSSPSHLTTSHNDLPIFSMNQVNAICERMIGERETAIREQYDKILTQKMSEQYDAFVKFTHEQIQRRFETSQCSYVS